MQNTLFEVPVGVSGRHVHLTREHLYTLFGHGCELTRIKDLGQPGQFAAQESVTIVGPKGVLEKVRIIGPVRSYSQVEISRTDAFKLGVTPPIRDSGDHDGSPGCVLVGPAGVVALTEGVIIPLRHIHMHTSEGKRFGIKDKEMVDVIVGGERGLIFRNVLVRVNYNSRLEFHIDTDEANACLLNTNDIVRAVTPVSMDQALSMVV